MGDRVQSLRDVIKMSIAVEHEARKQLRLALAESKREYVGKYLSVRKRYAEGEVVRYVAYVNGIDKNGCLRGSYVMSMALPSDNRQSISFEEDDTLEALLEQHSAVEHEITIYNIDDERKMRHVIYLIESISDDILDRLLLPYEQHDEDDEDGPDWLDEEEDDDYDDWLDYDDEGDDDDC